MAPKDHALAVEIEDLSHDRSCLCPECAPEWNAAPSAREVAERSLLEGLDYERAVREGY